MCVCVFFFHIVFTILVQVYNNCRNVVLVTSWLGALAFPCECGGRVWVCLIWHDGYGCANLWKKTEWAIGGDHSIFWKCVHFSTCFFPLHCCVGNMKYFWWSPLSLVNAQSFWNIYGIGFWPPAGDLFGKISSKNLWTYYIYLSIYIHILFQVVTGFFLYAGMICENFMI